MLNFLRIRKEKRKVEAEESGISNSSDVNSLGTDKPVNKTSES